MKKSEFSLYLSKAQKLSMESIDINYVIHGLIEYDASLVVILKVLQLLGYDYDVIESAIEKTELWKQYDGTTEDLFFSLLEFDSEEFNDED